MASRAPTSSSTVCVAPHRLELGKTIQTHIEIQHVVRPIWAVRRDRLAEIHPPESSLSLACVLRARMIDQNTVHNLRRNREEMSAVLVIFLTIGGHSNVSFVY